MTQIEFDAHHPPLDTVDAPAYPQLTAEQFRPTSWRKVALTAVLAMLVYIVLNGLFYFYLQSQDAAERRQSLLAIKWSLLLSLESPLDWLILGDSSANQGVEPELFESELGGTSVNLGTIGDVGLVNVSWQLEEYLRRFTRAENVVIVHVYDTLHRSVLLSRLLDIPLPVGFWSTYQTRLNPPVSMQVQYVFDRLVPLYSRNRTLELLVRTYQFGYKLPIFTDKGMMQMYDPDPQNVELDLQGHIRFTEQSRFSVSDENQKAMTHLIGMAEKNQFQIYFKLSPQHDALYANESYVAYLADLDLWLREIDRSSPNFCYFPDPSPFPAEMLQNSDHVIYAGAIQFTNQLIDLIRSAPETCSG